MLKEKYQGLIKFGEDIELKEEYVKEEEGKLKIKGTVEYQIEKDRYWNKIKSFSEWKEEVSADIRVEKDDIYGKYEVKSGDSLSKIAKEFYGDPMRYKEIFEMNTDILKNPDLIQIGQVLKMPKKYT
ncbi:MAG: LysM peptidoglycan-binding domain-containing protein [Acidobacteriota bacterium]